jgi:hypothetical protein
VIPAPTCLAIAEDTYPARVRCQPEGDLASWIYARRVIASTPAGVGFARGGRLEPGAAAVGNGGVRTVNRVGDSVVT